MFEQTQRQVDHDIQQSMDLFRRAKVGSVSPIQPLVPKRVLVALDGSAQDELSAAIANQLQARLNCELAVVDATETSGRTVDIPEPLQAASSLDAIDDDSYEQIVVAAADWNAELVIVPCPFGRDFETIGADSTGTVIDVLLARLPMPLIATRAPFDPAGDVFSRLRMVLTGENEAARAAAQWAAGLVHPEGHLELMLEVEGEFFENVREAMQSVHPDAEVSIESLESALAKTHARLHVGLQQAAAAGGFDYELSIHRQSEAEPFTVNDPAAHPPLLVLALERADSASQGHVHSRIRRSPHPVLVVSVD